MESPDFVHAAHAVESIQIPRVARCKFARLEITAAQVRIAKGVGALPGEKMKTQPAAVARRHALGFSKKRDEQKKDEIRVDARLKLKVANKIFRRDLAHSAFELKRGVQSVVEFFDKHDQRPNVAIAQARARIVSFKLFDQPARIIDADVKLVSGAPQERARKFAEFTGRFAGEHGQLCAARPINQTIFEVDSNLRVRSFK